MRTNSPLTPPSRPSLTRGNRPDVRTPITPVTPSQKSASRPPIEITLSLPKLPHVSLGTIHRTFKRVPRWIYIALGSALLLAAVGSFLLFLQDRQRKTQYTTLTANGTAVTELNVEQPDYSTLLPEGKNITDLGGWTRVSPSDRNPVFAYVDHIGTVQINVSQQPIPKAFEGDLDNQIAYLAKGYHADIKIDAEGTAVYVGTSAKGPQSVIFTKKGLLILIKTTTKVDNDAWAAYVTSLK